MSDFLIPITSRRFTPSLVKKGAIEKCPGNIFLYEASGILKRFFDYSVAFISNNGSTYHIRNYKGQYPEIFRKFEELVSRSEDSFILKIGDTTLFIIPRKETLELARQALERQATMTDKDRKKSIEQLVEDITNAND